MLFFFSQAVQNVHNTIVNGRQVYCGRAQKKNERSRELMRRKEEQRQERLSRYQGVNLYIKNLEDTLGEEKLKSEFSKFGSITSAKVRERIIIIMLRGREMNLRISSFKCIYFSFPLSFPLSSSSLPSLPLSLSSDNDG